MIILDWISHIALAVILGYFLDYSLLYLTKLETILYYTFIIIGSLLPDVDTPKSKVGCKIRPFSDIFFNAFGHRTATHSILVVTILFFVSVLFWGINIIAVGLLLGVILHILGDMMTPQGVAMVYPYSKKRYKLIK